MVTRGHKLLLRWIDDNEVSKTQLAEDLGMSKQSLGHVTSGRRRATIRQAIAIRNVAGIPVDAWLQKPRGRKSK